MLITIKRPKDLSLTTISEFEFNSSTYFVLEDENRNLTETMSVNEIKEIKVNKNTCIPYGTYQVIWSYSNRFKRFMPELLNVKGFDGIRIHAGNTISDTDGCLVIGLSRKCDSVLESRIAVKRFEKDLLKVIKKEKVFIKLC